MQAPEASPGDEPLAEDRALIERAARQAGELAGEYFGRLKRGEVRSWDKAPGSVVCDADLAVDRFLKERLRSARPDYGWLSEETADDAERLGRSRVWVVDPIDGTRDFVRGRTGFAISVALVEDGRPVLAALAAPGRDEFYLAEAGRGATLNGEPIRVSGRGRVEGCRVPADPAMLGSRRWSRPWPAVAVEKPNGLALRMAMVASGEADAFFELRPVAQWDVAAAALLVEEAGGLVGDGQGRPLRFNRADTRFRGVVATSPALFDEVRTRLAGFRTR